jgi:hypothetical protein
MEASCCERESWYLFKFRIMHSFRKCDDDVTVFILGISQLLSRLRLLMVRLRLFTAGLKDITVNNQVVPVLPSCPRIAVVSP